ncbi:CheY-like chemotaxis protein [Silvimonas terrae]|uniref:CheY-like chemotaxis protein n=1 Tax=Silvimonas terrae TaxID=300266 RepID=A0A840RCL1_9NEIS|nr:response regulator [Silvimonas terrae]MBB5190156.1 CheY-like chemotaxis protein [Silvimonas terrae]
MSTELTSPPAETGTAPVVTALLVEDSVLIREALVEALSASGHVVFTAFAATANDAIAALKQQRFDLAVIDLELLEGTGFDVLSYIKNNELNPPVRVVLTNHAFSLYERRARMLGVEHFFDKSMHFTEAVQTIENVRPRLPDLPA